MSGAGNLNFFDVNCMFGRRSSFRGRFFWKKEELTAALDKAGISRALVCHSLIRELHFLEGNAELLREIEGEGRLAACFGVLPDIIFAKSQDLPSVDGFVSCMKDNNVRAARVFPGDSLHRFSMSEWSMGRLYRKFEEARIPLIVDYGLFSYKEGSINWEEINDICRNYPGMPVILTGPGYRSCRYLVPLLKACPNLCIDISRFMTHRGIEFVCREVDAGRLFFGTNLPFQEPGAIMAMVLCSKISGEEKALIAGLNLEKLLNGVKW